jgi:hypothetical protein
MPVNTIDTIEPKNAGAFPVVRDVDIQGSIQAQPNLAAIQAIPQNNQKVGMLAYDLETETYWQLVTVGNPGTWQVANLGSATVNTLSGDVSGSSNANTVAKIQGTSVSSNSVANDGYALVSTGGVYVPTGVTPVFNVKNFGAKGNGVTNDTTAINNAISAASNNTNAIILFPIGTYLVDHLSLTKTAGIAAGLKFRGASVPQIANTNMCSIIKWTGNGGDSCLIEFALTFCTFEDLWFHGGGFADVLHITYNGGPAAQSRFDRCFITNAAANTGILVNIPGTSEIDQVNFHDCTITQDVSNSGATCLHAIVNSNTAAFLCDFRNCEISGSLQALIVMQAQNSSSPGGSNNFFNCEFYRMGGPIFLIEACNQMTIQDCYTEAGSQPWIAETNNISGMTYEQNILIKNCQMLVSGTYCVQLLGKNPITFENCCFGGNTISVQNIGPFKPVIRNCTGPSLTYLNSVVDLPLFDNPQNIDLDNFSVQNNNYINSNPIYHTITQFSSRGELDVKAWMAYGDGYQVLDGYCSGTGWATGILTSASANFVPTDVGKNVYVYKNSASVFWQVSKITGYSNSTTVIISPDTMGGSITGAVVVYGHNDTGPLQNASSAALAAGKRLRLTPGTYLVLSGTMAACEMDVEPGAQLLITGASNTGATFTFNGLIKASRTQQIFTGQIGTTEYVASAYSNTFAFAKASQGEVYPEWWGTNTYSASTCSPLQLASNAAAEAGLKVRLANSTYNIGINNSSNTGLIIANSDLYIQGDSDGMPDLSDPYYTRNTTIEYLGTGTAMTIGTNPGSSYSNFVCDIRLEDFTLLTPTASIGLWLWAVNRGKFNRLSIFGPAPSSNQPAIPTTSTPTTGIGILSQGSIFCQFHDCIVIGDGYQGNIANFNQRAIGCYVGSAFGNTSTTMDFYSCYFQYCYVGAWVETSLANFINCVFEGSGHGLYGNYNSFVRSENCHFEDNGYTLDGYEGCAMMSGGAKAKLSKPNIALYSDCDTVFQIDPTSTIDLRDGELITTVNPTSLLAGIIETSTSVLRISGLYASQPTTIQVIPTLDGYGETPDYTGVQFTDLKYVTYSYLAISPNANMNQVQIPTAVGLGRSGTTAAYIMPQPGYVVGLNVYFFNTITGTFEVQVGSTYSSVNHIVLDTGTNSQQAVFNRNVLSAPFPIGNYLAVYLTTSSNFVGGDIYMDVTVALGNPLL